MPDLPRLLRTVAHLEPGQVWHRVRLAARRRLWERRSAAVDARYRARAAKLGLVAFDHPGLARVADYRTGARVEELARVANDALAGSFTFLNRRIDFGRAVDWHRADLDVGTRLWKTHLHEFSYAPALALAHRLDPQSGYRERLFELIASWSAASPIGRRDFALESWNASAVPTRALHWAVAGSLLGLAPGSDDGRALGRHIGVHGLFLRDNLELDLRGNHLLRDAKGLVFADTLAGGVPDALAVLEAQVREQVLPDGCHVERAPMYHAVCLEDLLEAALLLGEAAPRWPAPSHPERHGGLVPLHRGTWRAVVRGGPHGPDYLLGHAHADLLSFDLSAGSRRVVTDTGTPLYDPGPVRQYARSTAAHNTRQIDAQEQIEAWGSFRVGRRGKARVRARGGDAQWTWVWAEADSFARQPGHPVHHRLLAVSDSGVIAIDAVLGEGTHAIASRLHLHPDRPDTGCHVGALAAVPTCEEAPLHERFGETREMTCLTVAHTGPLPWVGGWWIGRGDASAPDGSFECNLRIANGVVSLTDAAGNAPGVRWRVAAAQAPDPVVFCSPERESATYAGPAGRVSPQSRGERRPDRGRRPTDLRRLRGAAQPHQDAGRLAAAGRRLRHRALRRVGRRGDPRRPAAAPTLRSRGAARLLQRDPPPLAGRPPQALPQADGRGARSDEEQRVGDLPGPRAAPRRPPRWRRRG